MSKCLTVAAFVLLVLSGAMGLKSLAVSSAASKASSPVIWANGPGPIINPGQGGGGQ